MRDNKWHKGGVKCKISSKLELELRQPKNSYGPTKVMLALYMGLTILAFAQGPNSDNQDFWIIETT